MEIWYREVCVETYVFDPVGILKIREPFFYGAKWVQDVIVNVDLETEYFSFLELWLQSRVASSFTLFPATCGDEYLKGEACSSETRRPTTLILYPVLFRISRLGLSVIN